MRNPKSCYCRDKQTRYFRFMINPGILPFLISLDKGELSSLKFAVELKFKSFLNCLNPLTVFVASVSILSSCGERLSLKL